MCPMNFAVATHFNNTHRNWRNLRSFENFFCGECNQELYRRTSSMTCIHASNTTTSWTWQSRRTLASLNLLCKLKSLIPYQFQWGASLWLDILSWACVHAEFVKRRIDSGYFLIFIHLLVVIVGSGRTVCRKNGRSDSLGNCIVWPNQVTTSQMPSPSIRKSTRWLRWLRGPSTGPKSLPINSI